MKCPHCGNEINIGSLLGSTTSKAKARAARRNAKLGGWPKGRKLDHLNDLVQQGVLTVDETGRFSCRG